LFAAGGPAQEFVALAANVTDAFTAALLVRDSGSDRLKIAAIQSLSDHLESGALLPAGSGFWAELLKRGAPVQDTSFQGDSAELGIYSRPEPIRGFMSVPVGPRALLWVDTCRVYRFTGKHLKVLVELASCMKHLLDLSSQIDHENRTERDLSLLGSVLALGPGRAAVDNGRLDELVETIYAGGEFDGVLAARPLEDGGLLRIAAALGFSPWVKKGRLVRRGSGCVDWCLRMGEPKFMAGPDPEGRPIVLFHTGERFGFQIKSSGVIPWSGAAGQGVLVMASQSPDGALEGPRTGLAMLGRLIGVVESVSFQENLLGAVRRFDGESGLPSEGYFREISRKTFSEVEARKGALALFLMFVADIERLYLTHERSVMNRFFETIADQLKKLTRGRGLAGKFRTGGFAVLVEALPAREVDLLIAKSRNLFGSGRVAADGVEIEFELRCAAAHYPDDCADIGGLWQTALSRLDRQGR
jgi:GGDEF domain-containing protein